MKISILFIYSLIFFIFGIKGTQTKENNLKSSDDWKILETYYKSSDWIEINELDKIQDLEIKKLKILEKEKISLLKDNFIKAVGNGVIYKNNFYPDLSSYVPNGFVEDDEKLITTNLRAISRTRVQPHGRGKDATLDTDIKVFANDAHSLLLRWSVQSLTNQGTKIGEGNSFGIKYSKKLTDKWSIAIGGNNILHMDNTIDLGKNYYIVGSTHLPSKFNENAALFMNFGIGSDFFGYKGNGYIATTSCFSGPTLTGEGTGSCNWGPIGSVAYAFNSRFSLVTEWFGYGYGAGVSFRPFRDNPLTATIMVTDFLGNFPKYISEGESGCYLNECSARLYGNLSFSF